MPIHLQRQGQGLVPFFSHSRRLLFLFFLRSFLKSYTQAKSLELQFSHFTPLLLLSPNVTPKEYLSSFLLTLEPCLNRLLASDLSLFHPIQGYLLDFKESWIAFKPNCRKSKASLSQMEQAIEKSFKIAFKIREKTLLLKHQKMAKSTIKQIYQLKHFVKNLMEELNTLSTKIWLLLEEFKDDEVIYHYLLRNHKHLDEVYGDRFTANLLLKLYPAGFEALHQFLSDHFSKRSFHHLLKTLDTELRALQNSATGK